MKCSKCGRGVKETVHYLDHYEVDYYGTFITANGRTEPISIVCKECYEG